MRVIIGLGGNLGTLEERMERFVAAVDRLRARLPVTGMRASGLYRSAAVGPVSDQPDFVNAVLALELDRPVAPLAILAELLDTEIELGRARGGKSVAKGPRTIDLDLLFVDRLVLSLAGPPALELPHPEICGRAFVLLPLAEVVGETWQLPGIEKTVAQCLAADEVRSQPTERIPDPASKSWLERFAGRNDGGG